MNHLAIFVILAAVLAPLVIGPGTGDDKDAARISVIVDVPPEKLDGRTRDQRPAEFRLAADDFATVSTAGRRIDLASIEVARLDDPSGRKPSQPIPLRWYDDSIPYDLPECEQNVHATEGVHLTFVEHPRWGEFYNLLGDGKSGRLVWLHEARPNRIGPLRDLIHRLLPALRGAAGAAAARFRGRRQPAVSAHRRHHDRHDPQPRHRRRLERRRPG